jgi:Protein phosphatase 2C
MRLEIRTFHVPKEGSSPEEYEDAWQCDGQAGILAVADGASDSFESRIWAHALVDAFVREPPLPDASSIFQWLAAPVQTWKASIHWSSLPWYSEEKARRGAFSTLLGVSLIHSEHLPEDKGAAHCRWRAIALGDTCLFHIRGDQLLMSFPIEKAEEFGTTPSLLSTRFEYSQRSLETLRVRECECQPEDLLLLTTDAFAGWLLSRAENGECLWPEIRGLAPEDFALLVNRARQQREMRNDDVTVLLVRHSNCVHDEVIG